MEGNRIAKRVLCMNLGTTRLRGRPRNRLCWFGHVQRMGENKIAKRVLCMNLGTTRLRGRPRNRLCCMWK